MLLWLFDIGFTYVIITYQNWSYELNSIPLDLQLPMQSVPITTNVSLNPAHSEVYSIQLYVVKIVSDWWEVWELFLGTPQWLVGGMGAFPWYSTVTGERYGSFSLVLHQ